MNIQENVKLAPFTTFKIGGPARYFCIVKDQSDALEAYEFAKKNQLSVLVLGGGSNVLISDEGFGGLVIKIENKGIEILNTPLNPPLTRGEIKKNSPPILGGDRGGEVLLKVASGEIWDEVVKFAVSNNWWGIENLSHIPGFTGAIAVQNVGAYGQQAAKVIESVDVFNKDTHNIQNIKNSDCHFDYRKSIFNSTLKGKFIIFHVYFRLQKNGSPNLSYADLKKYFSISQTLSVPATPGHLPQKGENNNVLSLAEIRQAIITIRDKKFPFPTEAIKGNAGSFFKNPVLSQNDYGRLIMTVVKNFGAEIAKQLETKKFTEEGKVKVPAAFLVELCDLKNREVGGAAINPNQPLVIINKTGTATASDVLALAGEVRKIVSAKCAIKLEFEPELIGFSHEALKALNV
jgi:UDP-N-acetylmuramate dehydrogenase